MPRPRARKKSVVPSRRPAILSSHVTQATISSYHTLLKRQSHLLRQLSSVVGNERVNVRAELAAIDEELRECGGLEVYQMASTLGQSTERGGDSSKVLISWMKELGLSRKGKEREVRWVRQAKQR